MKRASKAALSSALKSYVNKSHSEDRRETLTRAGARKQLGKKVK